MRRHCALVLSLSTVVVGCTFRPSAAPEPTQTYINVAEVAQSQEMSLEVGDTAWSFTADTGGGVATPELSEPETARIVAVDDCQVYAEFEAVPGRAYLVRVELIGTVTVEDITDTGMARPMGPGLVERPEGPPDCD